MERIILAASIITVAAMLLASASLARAQYPSYNTHGQHQAATLSGTVERVISPTEFTLRADHKVVKINVASKNPPVLNEGDNITVTGVPGSAKQAIRVYTVSMDQRANT